MYRCCFYLQTIFFTHINIHYDVIANMWSLKTELFYTFRFYVLERIESCAKNGYIVRYIFISVYFL